MKKQFCITHSSARRICFGFVLLLWSPLVPAQSLFNWSIGGNSAGAGDYIGTNNNEDFTIKTNGNISVKVKANGNVILKAMEGLGSGMLLFDNNGKLNPLVFSGNAAHVLKGDGSFGPVPGNFWTAGTSGRIYYNGGKVGIGTSTPLFKLDVHGNMRVTHDLYLQGALYMADSIIVDTTTGFYGISKFNGEVRLEDKLEVDGNAIVHGDLKTDGDLTFAGDKGIRFTPAHEAWPGMYEFGPGPAVLLPDQCSMPPVNLFQFQGNIQVAGYNTLSAAPNVLTMGYDGANGFIDLAGAGDPESSSRLLINYYCGKDVLMCTGAAGGNVKMCTGPGDVSMGSTASFPGNKLAVVGNTYMNGRLGVGLSSPAATVHIKNESGESAIGLRVTSDSVTGTGIHSEVLKDDDKALVVSKLTGEPNFIVYGDGHVFAREIKVTMNPLTHSDYVFESDYSLMPLAELEQYVKTHKHLPGVPSTKDVTENKGIDLGEMTEIQLAKIEELSLYIMEMNKKLDKLSAVVELQKKEIKGLKGNEGR